MIPMLRKLHKWVGLLVGVQFLIWLASGLTMSLFDHHVVSGQMHRAPARTLPVWPAAELLSPREVLMSAKHPVESVEAYWLGSTPAYRLKGEEVTWLVSAKSGEALTVGPTIAAQLARADYTGSGTASAARLMIDPSLETRRHSGPIWRVDFNDTDATTVYVSGEDGRVLERRNNTWRWFDIAWMLHIMDYSGRQDFNNALVVTAAVAGLWMALSGIWLLCVSLRLQEFVPARWLPRKSICVLDETGKRIGIVEAHIGDTVFNALGRAGIQLPSNCGGGQSCGMCEIRACQRAPVATTSDAEHIPEQRLRRGHRLACGMVVQEDLEIAVGHGAALMTSRAATVERVTAVTPFLREIVLRPDHKASADFQPGCYVQLQIPRYKFGMAGLHRPDHHHEDWMALELPAVFRSKQPLRRAYSLAMPPVHADGCLTLLVRFSPGRRHAGHAPGKGSSYVYSLQPGDRVTFNGPFGEFALRRGHAEKIFIGGGAGMAPLRAMIHALLESGSNDPIQFWYGARTMREVPYADEFDSLARRHPNFRWHAVLSDEDGRDENRMRGMVHQVAHDESLQAHPAVRNCDFYVCGPPAMLQATRDMLQKLGAQRVAFDDFKI
ncbi:PepSY domain-containing protein [Pseudoduganella sp. UC29_106]|uniref:PepSY domain-containing protein n=1 Tax=Pseudoduganella sp. UC29_106 TaxID=3374553 RepID=UPI003757B5CB